MKIWLLTNKDNTGYDTFDGMVVQYQDVFGAIESAQRHAVDHYGDECTDMTHCGWTNHPRVKLLGENDDDIPGVILTSYTPG